MKRGYRDLTNSKEIDCGSDLADSWTVYENQDGTITVAWANEGSPETGPYCGMDTYTAEEYAVLMAADDVPDGFNFGSEVTA